MADEGDGDKKNRKRGERTCEARFGECAFLVALAPFMRVTFVLHFTPREERGKERKQERACLKGKMR